MSYLDAMVGIQGGYFEEAGLEVELLPMVPNSPQVAALVAQGEADVAGVGSSPVVTLVNEGRTLKILAAESRETSMIIVGPSVLERLAEDGITPESPVEDRVKALADMSIAVRAIGGSNDLYVQQLLAAHGAPYDATKIVGISDHQAAALAVMEGLVDASVIQPPYAFLPEQREKGAIWINPLVDELGINTDQLLTLWAVNTDFLESNPEAVERFYQALVTIREEINNNPAHAAELFYAGWGEGMVRDLANKAVESVGPAWSGPPTMTRAVFDATVEATQATAEGTINLTYEDAVWQGAQE